MSSIVLAQQHYVCMYRGLLVSLGSHRMDSAGQLSGSVVPRQITLHPLLPALLGRVFPPRLSYIESRPQVCPVPAWCLFRTEAKEITGKEALEASGNRYLSDLSLAYRR